MWEDYDLDTSFANVSRGNRLDFAGLEMVPGYNYRYAPDYSYIEIPILGFYLDNEEKLVEKAMRNQYVRVLPACTIRNRGNYHIQVEPNPELAKHGLFQPTYYVNPDPKAESMRPGFYMQMRRDLEIGDVPYSIRLYLRA